MGEVAGGAAGRRRGLTACYSRCRTCRVSSCGCDCGYNAPAERSAPGTDPGTLVLPHLFEASTYGGAPSERTYRPVPLAADHPRRAAGPGATRYGERGADICGLGCGHREEEGPVEDQ